MKRLSILLSAAVLVALATTGLAIASGGATLQLHKSKFGKILVNGRGFTLYEFAADRRNKDNCVKNPSCIAVWPPVTTSGTPIAKSGVKRSLIGTIKLPNGKTQVTYAGHPVYTYLGDMRAGETNGQNLFQSGAKWYVLNGAGHVVK